MWGHEARENHQEWCRKREKFKVVGLGMSSLIGEREHVKLAKEENKESRHSRSQRKKV
jgi:hypothetical protein